MNGEKRERGRGERGGGGNGKGECGGGVAGSRWPIRAPPAPRAPEPAPFQPLINGRRRLRHPPPPFFRGASPFWGESRELRRSAGSTPAGVCSPGVPPGLQTPAGVAPSRGGCWFCPFSSHFQEVLQGAEQKREKPHASGICVLAVGRTAVPAVQRTQPRLKKSFSLLKKNNKTTQQIQTQTHNLSIRQKSIFHPPPHRHLPPASLPDHPLGQKAPVNSQAWRHAPKVSGLVLPDQTHGEAVQTEKP